MTTPTHSPADRDRFSSLRATLATDFETQTARLTQLTADTGDPSDPHTQAAMIATTRQSLEQITAALRRMAEGTYGSCERCEKAIPTERLEILPHARFCVPCQSKQ